MTKSGAKVHKFWQIAPIYSVITIHISWESENKFFINLWQNYFYLLLRLALSVLAVVELSMMRGEKADPLLMVLRLASPDLLQEILNLLVVLVLENLEELQE